VTIRILIVDDSVVIRKLLTTTLGDVPGMEIVATAALGSIALTKIQQLRPDVVILDVEMPEMDGIETLKRIRKDSPRLPVIMFSTRTERGAAATIEALTSGASDYVAKPSNVGNVLVAMARVRDEMVPKILALTGGTAHALRPPTGAPMPAAAGAPPRPTTKISTDAIARPAVAEPRSTAKLALDGIPRPAAAEPRPTTKLLPLTANPTGLATAAMTALSPQPATEPRPTTKVAGHPASPATIAMPVLAALAAGEPRTTTRSARPSQNPMTGPIPRPLASEPRAPVPRFTAPRRPVEIVAIGASTGGPNALATMLTQLPADFSAPIVIVQHMLATFTRHFAERLASQCSIKILEATAGDPLVAGHAYIARGDFHLLVERRAGRVLLAMNQDQVENYCRPAVDVLFRSVAQVYGASALAVVLTGMGHDGLAGCGAIRDAGGDVIVQDEATSVVWGMPGFVARAGLASQVMPIEQIGGELRRRAVATGARGVEVAP
jgi:two-component system chemotaxis response regulator CheB